jgi:ornithine cyclodeaminase
VQYVNLQQIKELVNLEKDWALLLSQQKQAFIDFSNGLFQVPMPIAIDITPNDCHIKAGYLAASNIIVVKVSTGVYQHYLQNTATGDGAFLVLSASDGQLNYVIHDQGYLTLLRTALAAGIATQLTPWPINKIGIIGTGQLAKWIVKLMEHLHPDTPIFLGGRDYNKVSLLASKKHNISKSIDDLLTTCDVVITATASRDAFIDRLINQQHIIALGADDTHKSECNPTMHGFSDLVIVDSIEQAKKLGDVAQALKQGVISEDQLITLGHIIEKPGLLNNADQIITDLTGVAAQDVVIAASVIDRLLSEQKSFYS